MRILLSTLILLASSVSFALEVYTSEYTNHSIRSSAELIRVRLVVKDFKTDGCNHYGVNGSLRKVELPEGMQTIVKDFVADYGVMQTEIACPGANPGLIDLETEWVIIAKPSYVNILAPAMWELEVMEDSFDPPANTLQPK